MQQGNKREGEEKGKQRDTPMQGAGPEEIDCRHTMMNQQPPPGASTLPLPRTGRPSPGESLGPRLTRKNGSPTSADVSQKAHGKQERNTERIPALHAHQILCTPILVNRTNIIGSALVRTVVSKLSAPEWTADDAHKEGTNHSRRTRGKNLRAVGAKHAPGNRKGVPILT